MPATHPTRSTAASHTRTTTNPPQNPSIQPLNQRPNRRRGLLIRLPLGNPLHDNIHLIPSHALVSQRRLKPKFLHELQNLVPDLGRVGHVISPALLAQHREDARNTRGVVRARLGLELDDITKSHARGDAVGDGVGAAEGVAEGVRQPQGALHVEAEEAQGGVGGEVEVEDDVLVARVGFVLGQVVEELLDGGEGGVVGRHGGGGRVVLELDGVVEGADARGQKQIGRAVQGEFAVVQDKGGVDGGVGDAGLDAVGLRVAGEGRAFGGGQGGGDGDVVEEGLAAVVQPVGDGFGAVDGRAAADADDGVDRGVGEHDVGRFVQLGHGRVLFDRAEGAGVRGPGLQQVLHLFDQWRLGGERVAGDDERFGRVGGETRQEVLLHRVGSVVEGFEWVGLVEPAWWVEC